MLAATVRHRTVIRDGYRRHASHESMTAYLVDWQRARDRLDRQIAALTELRDERRAASERGDWPPIVQRQREAVSVLAADAGRWRTAHDIAASLGISDPELTAASLDRAVEDGRVDRIDPDGDGPWLYRLRGDVR